MTLIECRDPSLNKLKEEWDENDRHFYVGTSYLLFLLFVCLQKCHFISSFSYYWQSLQREVERLSLQNQEMERRQCSESDARQGRTEGDWKRMETEKRARRNIHVLTIHINVHANLTCIK